MKLVEHLRQTKGLDNRAFRLWFRENAIPKAYHPWLHIGFNLGALLTAIFINLYFINQWNLPVLGVFVFTILLGNIVVWGVHRYPLHRRFKFWSYPYDTHTVMHHRYFTADHINFDHKLDYYAIFFPASVVAGFVFLAQPFFYYAGAFLWNANIGHALAAGTALYFLLYEFVHWASHLPANHFLMRVPWLRFMRTHHLAHHSPRLMMKYNFCIVYPLMDYLMGTRFKGELPAERVADHYEDVEANLK